MSKSHSPHLRPLQLEAVYDELLDLAERIRKTAPTIAVGWSALKADLHAAGWPERTPDDDRTPDHRHIEPEPSTAQIVQRCECGNQFATLTEWDHHGGTEGHRYAVEVTTGHDSTGADHADPTGTAAGLQRHHADLIALQNDMKLMDRTWKDMLYLADRYRPQLHGVPTCTIGGCTSIVEQTGNRRGFIGMVQIDGVWHVRAGQRATCREHRSKRRGEK